jgi:hypothetical protein
MVIKLAPNLEAALNELARQQGISPEELALNTIRQHLLGRSAHLQPQDEWERHLLGAASDCGVTLSHDAVGSDGLYD